MLEKRFLKHIGNLSAFPNLSLRLRKTLTIDKKGNKGG